MGGGDLRAVHRRRAGTRWRSRCRGRSSRTPATGSRACGARGRSTRRGPRRRSGRGTRRTCRCRRGRGRRRAGGSRILLTSFFQTLFIRLSIWLTQVWLGGASTVLVTQCDAEVALALLHGGHEVAEAVGVLRAVGGPRQDRVGRPCAPRGRGAARARRTGRASPGWRRRACRACLRGRRCAPTGLAAEGLRPGQRCVARSLSVVAAVRANEARTAALAFPSSAAETTAGAKVRARPRATRVAASVRRM